MYIWAFIDFLTTWAWAWSMAAGAEDKMGSCIMPAIPTPPTTEPATIIPVVAPDA